MKPDRTVKPGLVGGMIPRLVLTIMFCCLHAQGEYTQAKGNRVKRQASWSKMDYISNKQDIKEQAYSDNRNGYSIENITHPFGPVNSSDKGAEAKWADDFESQAHQQSNEYRKASSTIYPSSSISASKSSYPMSENMPKKSEHEKDISVHEAEWVEDFVKQAGKQYTEELEYGKSMPTNHTTNVANMNTNSESYFHSPNSDNPKLNERENGISVQESGRVNEYTKSSDQYASREYITPEPIVYTASNSYHKTTEVPRKVEHEKEISVHEAEWVEDFIKHSKQPSAEASVYDKEMSDEYNTQSSTEYTNQNAYQEEPKKSDHENHVSVFEKNNKINVKESSDRQSYSEENILTAEQRYPEDENYHKAQNGVTDSIKDAKHEKDTSVHEAEWVKDFNNKARPNAGFHEAPKENGMSDFKQQESISRDLSPRTSISRASQSSSEMHDSLREGFIDPVDPTIQGNIITDKDAISKEIQRIDEAIANIDSAINTSSFSGLVAQPEGLNKDSDRIKDTNSFAKENDMNEHAEHMEKMDKHPNEMDQNTIMQENEFGKSKDNDKEDRFNDESVDSTSHNNIEEEEKTNENANPDEVTDNVDNHGDVPNDVSKSGADQAADPKPEDLTSGDDRSKELLDKFKKESTEYMHHEPQPSDTRRMFDRPADKNQFKVASLSRLRFFAKRNHMDGHVSDKENVCGKKQVRCDPSIRYRSFNGECNNLENPELGSTLTTLRRKLRPAYGDGIFLPRGVTEYTEDRGYISKLPSPRKLSDAIMDQGPEGLSESKSNTHMVMQFGQFISHDMMGVAKESFDCCADQIRNLDRCFPIDIPEDDSFYSVFGKKCLDFTRSDTHCGSNHVAEQFNLKTAFIDGSTIYGDNADLAQKLRSKDGGGKLRTNLQLKNFLPNKFELKIKNSEKDKPTDFVAGDDRVETQASLTSIHNLFLNEHNRVAEAIFQALKGKKGKSDKELDEFVYQETRRLVIAEIQHIAYQHFLPQVLGRDIIEKFNILARDCVYDPKADPSIINSFASAAFRFGHSLVQSIFRGENQPWRLGKFYADSRFARGNGGQDYVNELIGLSKQPCQKADVHITKQMTQMLFCNNETAPGGGHDIGSINIQRGRDHGIPGYNQFRKFCGLPPIQDLQEHPPNMDAEAWSKISSIYSSVEDVDLYVGGLAELPAQDGLVGPTFGCLIAHQFKALMDGDRFFYHHTGGPNIFPLKGAALEEIQSRTLGDIICESAQPSEIPLDVFVVNSGMVPCESHEKLDIKRIAIELEQIL